jgi:error-prone DNA polymerase
MLNNQPMGFYHPATLVKDAQRRGVSFAPIDVQQSDWECRIQPDGRVRLGLMYVNGLRGDVGKRIAESRGSRLAARGSQVHAGSTPPAQSERCPKCGCDDQSMLEDTPQSTRFCNICAHEWRAAMSDSEPANREPRTASREPRAASREQRTARYDSIDDFIARTGIRRDELATLAEIGALNAFGHDRRSALWQIERAIRPAGALFDQQIENHDPRPASRDPSTELRVEPRPFDSPLRAMTSIERLHADYEGTSLTIGPHPMALCRGELALRGVQRATDLPRGRSGRRVRVAGAVITRQRPGTAKGFVFLTLEDETGIANVIVQPDLFSNARATIVGAPYLLVEGILQIQEGVTSVKAERMQPLVANAPEPQSHDFR